MGQAFVKYASNNFGNTIVSHGPVMLGNFSGHSSPESALTNSNQQNVEQNALKHKDYTVAWISALPREQAALVLDDVHQRLTIGQDGTTYILGRIDIHNVVLACLATTGPIATNHCVCQLQTDFESLRFILLVGISGGIPTKYDIRLGDVVVSYPTKHHHGVIQFDHGTKFQDKPLHILPTALGRPAAVLVSATSSLVTLHAQPHEQTSLGEKMHVYATTSPQGPGTQRPARDDLFAATYKHADDALSCSQCACDMEQTVPRDARPDDYPHVHRGLIASGNHVLRDAAARDRLADETDALCVEMEAAGLQQARVGWLVVRGVCDYSDSHKSKAWQDYAAGVAAGYARELLRVVPGLRA